MLKLLFKTTAYYVIWQKFKKQIMMIAISIILVGFINFLYEDLFEVLKVTSRDSVGTLLFFKWFLICIIIGFNVYVLRKTKIDSKDLENKEYKVENKKNYSKIQSDILKKEKILTTTDLILKKYEAKI